MYVWVGGDKLTFEKYCSAKLFILAFIWFFVGVTIFFVSFLSRHSIYIFVLKYVDFTQRIYLFNKPCICMQFQNNIVSNLWPTIIFFEYIIWKHLAKVLLKIWFQNMSGKSDAFEMKVANSIDWLYTYFDESSPKKFQKIGIIFHWRSKETVGYNILYNIINLC